MRLARPLACRPLFPAVPNVQQGTHRRGHLPHAASAAHRPAPRVGSARRRRAASLACPWAQQACQLGPSCCVLHTSQEGGEKHVGARIALQASTAAAAAAAEAAATAALLPVPDVMPPGDMGIPIIMPAGIICMPGPPMPMRPGDMGSCVGGWVDSGRRVRRGRGVRSGRGLSSGRGDEERQGSAVGQTLAGCTGSACSPCTTSRSCALVCSVRTHVYDPKPCEAAAQPGSKRTCMRPGDSGAPGWRRSSYPCAKVHAPALWQYPVWRGRGGAVGASRWAAPAAACAGGAAGASRRCCMHCPAASLHGRVPLTCIYLMHSRVL